MQFLIRIFISENIQNYREKKNWITQKTKLSNITEYYSNYFIHIIYI